MKRGRASCKMKLTTGKEAGQSKETIEGSSRQSERSSGEENYERIPTVSLFVGTSASCLALPSNSACFPPSSWTTTSTTQGDTMCLGIPGCTNWRRIAAGTDDHHSTACGARSAKLVRSFLCDWCQRASRSSKLLALSHNSDPHLAS